MDSKPIEGNGHANRRVQADRQADSDHGAGDSDRDSPERETASTNGTHSAGTPGMFDTQPIEAMLRSRIPDEPSLEWTAVMEAVTNSGDATGDLTELHRQRYDSPLFPGAEVPALVRMLEPLKTYRDNVKTYVSSLKHRAAATDPFIDHPGEGTAWTTFDLIKVTVLSLVSVALLAIGVFTISQILLASGLPGFDDPVRRYLFSCVPVGGAFALKNLGSLITTDRGRRRYIGFVGIVGIVLAIAWSGLFVSSFDSGPMSSADDVLAELMDDSGKRDNSGNAGSALLLVGLLAEMFLASGCWLEIERIVMGHRLASRSLNPLRVAIDTEIGRWTSRLYMIDSLVGRLEARISSIKCGRATYVTRAVNHYRLLRRGLRCDDPAGTATAARDGRSFEKVNGDHQLVIERNR